MARPLPLVIGAALPIAWLETYRDWLFEKDRDLEVQGFADAHVLDGDWQSRADTVRRALDGFKGRLGIHGPFQGVPIDSRDPLVQQAVSTRMVQGVAVCAAIGATQMVIHSPFTPWDYNNNPRFPNAEETVFACAHATLAEAVRRAEDAGVTLVLENIADKDTGARVRLAERFASPAVRVSIDAGHAHLAHCTQGADPVDYFVRTAGAALAHMHLQDIDGHADRHWAIGEGTISWHGVFREIAALDTRPHLVLELSNPAGIPASMAYLERAGLAE